MKAIKQYSKTQFLTWIAFSLILLAGAAIRFYDFTDPPMDFHPARQFHSAIIARGIYTRLGGVYPGWQFPLNVAQEVSEIRIEPPVLEWATALTFLLFSVDHLWIARIYSILFWLSGGAGLYFLIGRIANRRTALLGMMVFLFLPYGVIASRSFQPDPMMVALSIWALWAAERWIALGSWKSAVLAGLLCGAAVFSKQVAAFPLAFACGGLVISHFGLRGAVKNIKAWLVVVLALLPSLLYNIYGIFIKGTLAGQYQNRFYPELYSDPGFYLRWAREIDSTAGIIVLLLAVIGVIILEKKAHRAMWLGYAAGYVVYGFVFALHISTHDYYQLPLFPFLAAGLAFTLDIAFEKMEERWLPGWTHTALVALLILGAGYYSYLSYSTLKKNDYRQVAETLSRLSWDMGGPGTPVVGVFDDYGASLNYWGYIQPAIWPSYGDLPSDTSFQDEFDTRTYAKNYFIITDFEEMNYQPELDAYLNEHYPIFYQDENLLIFDLRGGS